MCNEHHLPVSAECMNVAVLESPVLSFETHCHGRSKDARALRIAGPP